MDYNIDQILEIFLGKVSNEDDPDIRKRTKKMFYDDVRKEIIEKEKETILLEVKEKAEIIIKEANDEKNSLLEKSKKEIEKSKAMYAIKKAKNLFRDGIIIAFIVGILVNQVTELITPMKLTLWSETEKGKFLVTLILVTIIVIILYLIMKKNYFSKIEEYINKEELNKE